MPTVQWWRLDASEQAEELKRLESWTRTVYLPGYGHLAAALPACWAEHDLCLYILDWLIELWSVLYVATDEERTKGSSPGRPSLRPGSCPPPSSRWSARAPAAGTPGRGQRPAAGGTRGGSR